MGSFPAVAGETLTQIPQSDIIWPVMGKNEGKIDSALENWNDGHWYKVRESRRPECVSTSVSDETDGILELRSEIEPWLTALFQSEHLSLLLGGGISIAAHQLVEESSVKLMEPMTFSTFKKQVESATKETAKRSGRGDANVEDQIRVCNELIKGLKIYLSDNGFRGSRKLSKELAVFEEELKARLNEFAGRILECERKIIASATIEKVADVLVNFLASFASRSATRERLNIFTTNYDRVIEFGAELAGIRLIDRFVGTINPVFRSSRIDVDMHYNPPGIRGEPRYLEGVARFTKLHGSLDWHVKDNVVRRYALPYGANNIEDFLGEDGNVLLIYPNADKDRETSEYPYADLFRDFAASICRANSTVVVYGYSFGDDHINRIMADMLTIPSTHLVIISFDDQGGRVKKFYENAKKPAQISLLIGKYFGDLKLLTDYYLPKPAMDRTTIKMAELIKSRGWSRGKSELEDSDDKKPNNHDK